MNPRLAWDTCDEMIWILLVDSVHIIYLDKENIFQGEKQTCVLIGKKSNHGLVTQLLWFNIDSFAWVLVLELFMFAVWFYLSHGY